MSQYLIAHKCRGQPAFEIAEQQECAICRGMGCKECNDDGHWWITHYGHRAYPYWSRAVDQLCDVNLYMVCDLPPMPADLPEHFEASAAPKGKGAGVNGRQLLERIGLAKPMEPLTRRSW